MDNKWEQKYKENEIHIRKAMEKSEWDFDFGNKILYDLCETYPYHRDIGQIIGKIWLIGRSYTVAVERTKEISKYPDTEDFYIQQVGPTMQTSNIDEWIGSIAKLRYPTFENIESILDAHYKLTNLFNEITKLKNRSLASKYLHFHKKNLFFIYDSRSMKSIRQITPAVKKELSKSNNNMDPEYAEFCFRCLQLRDQIGKDFNKFLTPRALDNLLLLLAIKNK